MDVENGSMNVGSSRLGNQCSGDKNAPELCHLSSVGCRKGTNRVHDEKHVGVSSVVQVTFVVFVEGCKGQKKLMSVLRNQHVTRKGV